MIKPCGTNILLKIKKHSEVSEGGIILNSSEVNKEQAIEQLGEVVAIGPCAYIGWKGCEEADDSTEAAMIWGFEIGDQVEFKKYDAGDSIVDENDEFVFRYIPDISIMGVIT